MVVLAGGLVDGDEQDPVDAVPVHLEDVGTPPVMGVAGPVRQQHLVAGCGDLPELGEDQAAEGLVLAVRGEVSRQVGHLVDAEQPGAGPALLDALRLGLGFVVLVADVADDLLDQVLHGDDAGGTAVLVDDERDLHAVGADPFHDRVTVEGGRHDGHLPGEGAQLGVGAAPGGHGERVLDVHDADGGVEIAVDDGEAGVAGA